MAAFEAWLVFLILVVNVVGELQRKRTLAASRGFLAAARLSCFIECLKASAWHQLYLPLLPFTHARSESINAVPDRVKPSFVIFDIRAL